VAAGPFITEQVRQEAFGTFTAAASKSEARMVRLTVELSLNITDSLNLLICKSQCKCGQSTNHQLR
jgi:hypothetical protein